MSLVLADNFAPRAALRQRQHAQRIEHALLAAKVLPQLLVEEYGLFDVATQLSELVPQLGG